MYHWQQERTQSYQIPTANDIYKNLIQSLLAVMICVLTTKISLLRRSASWNDSLVTHLVT